MNATEFLDLIPSEWELEETDEGHEIRMDTAIEGNLPEGSMGYESQHVIEYQHGCNDEDVKPDQRDQANAIAGAISAIPELLRLAVAVAQDYEDAADWKDARGKLKQLADSAIHQAMQPVEWHRNEESETDEDEDEDEDDET